MQVNIVSLSIVAFIVIASCCGKPVNDESKTILFENDHDIDKYHFRYYIDTGISRDETGELKTKGNEEILVVNGSYEYTQDLKRYIVKYTADENGYRAKVEVLPLTGAVPGVVLASLAGGGLG